MFGYIKEVAAGLSAGIAALVGTLQAGGHLTLVAWLIAAGAALSGSGLVAGGGAIASASSSKTDTPK
jgi:hypothetical protein